MSLTKEQLLSPRYKVIADYPESIFPVGGIIKEADNYQGAVFFQTTVHKYSNIFRPMEWWEDRTPIEMPDYVSVGGIIEKAVYWAFSETGNPLYIFLDKKGREKHSSVVFTMPSTEQEYNTYINKQK